MRLGSYACALKPGTLAQGLYGSPEISERHRHRYEVNNNYREQLEKGGLVVSGTNPDLDLVEMVELPKETHPYFVACQFHPEFKSKPFAPHPLFSGFIRSAVYSRDQKRPAAAVQPEAAAAPSNGIRAPHLEAKR
jgi:CTP synthase